MVGYVRGMVQGHVPRIATSTPDLNLENCLGTWRGGCTVEMAVGTGGVWVQERSCFAINRPTWNYRFSIASAGQKRRNLRRLDHTVRQNGAGESDSASERLLLSIMEGKVWRDYSGLFWP